MTYPLRPLVAAHLLITLRKPSTHPKGEGVEARVAEAKAVPEVTPGNSRYNQLYPIPHNVHKYDNMILL
jgi:hypothetical protein